MKNKVFTFFLLLSIIAVSGMWAQNLPNIPGTNTGIWASPQSTATEGRYRSNADDFIRPDNYTNVNFDKWFSMVSFLTNYGRGDDDIATAGFATRVNNLYIAGFYGGNFWTGAAINEYTERSYTEDSVPAGGTARKTYKVYNSISIASGPVNNFALLIGVADMGFRLTYRTNHQLFNDSDIVYRNDLYKSYQTELGYIAPQIAWAMAKNLTSNGIRPYVTIDLVFNRNYQRAEPVAGTVIGTGDEAVTVTGEKITLSENHFDPSLALGLGGYTFYNKDGFRFSADIDYVLTLNIYDNEYSYVDGDQYKTGKINGTFGLSGNFPYEEKSYISNLLTPSVSGQWSEGRLALRFKLNLPLTLINEETSRMGLNDSFNLIKAGPNATTTTFTFRPDLRLALQYRIIPDRLTLNAGARIQATALTFETTSRKDYDNDGNITESSKNHKGSAGAIGDFRSRFNIGVTCNLTKNAWVEAITGISGEKTIDVFAPGGLFSFGSILFVLKF